MKASIVRIGNSRGIRIPKTLLDQTGLDGEVDIRVRGKGLVIEPIRHARDGWEESFQEMAADGADTLLDGDHSTTSWDEDEWQW